jgi:hypothetical protein
MLRKDKFRDLTNAGSMLNAILFATNRGVLYQLAKFAVNNTLTDETIYLTGGVLFNALAMAEAMSGKYRGVGFVKEMDDLGRSFRDFKPPRVLVSMRRYGLFKLYTHPDATGLVDRPATNGKRQLFPEKQKHVYGIPIATFADIDEVTSEGLEGLVDLHISLESLVTEVSEEVILALESFICGMAKELGLSPLNN